VIDRQEIMDFSREFGLTANIIEKEGFRIILNSGQPGFLKAGRASRSAILKPIDSLRTWISQSYKLVIKKSSS
jgi:hypothetical protein